MENIEKKKGRKKRKRELAFVFEKEKKEIMILLPVSLSNKTNADIMEALLYIADNTEEIKNKCIPVKYFLEPKVKKWIYLDRSFKNVFDEKVKRGQMYHLYRYVIAYFLEKEKGVLKEV